MFFKKILLVIYKFISKLYVLIFGHKKLQFINNALLSLALDAKGFKNYGDFNRTGEKKFIRLIKDEINLSLDIGANVGNYTKLILQETNSKVISFEPLPDAYKELEVLKAKSELDNISDSIFDKEIEKIFLKNNITVEDYKEELDYYLNNLSEFENVIKEALRRQEKSMSIK